MLVASNQPLVGDIREVRVDGGRIDFRANYMDGDSLPVVGDGFVLEDIAIKNPRLVGDGDNLTIAALRHLDSGAGAGIIAIDIGVACPPGGNMPGMKHTGGCVDHLIYIGTRKTMLLVIGGGVKPLGL